MSAINQDPPPLAGPQATPASPLTLPAPIPNFQPEPALSLMSKTEPNHFCFGSPHPHRLEPLLFASPTLTSIWIRTISIFLFFSFPQYALGPLLSPPTPIPQHRPVSPLLWRPTPRNTPQNLYGIKAQALSAVGVVPGTLGNTNHTWSLSWRINLSGTACPHLDPSGHQGASF